MQPAVVLGEVYYGVEEEKKVFCLEEKICVYSSAAALAHRTRLPANKINSRTGVLREKVVV